MTATKTLTLGQASDFAKAVHELVGNLAGPVTRKIAINLQNLSRAFPNTMKAVQAIYEQHGSPKEGTPAAAEFMTAKLKYETETTIEVELHVIKFGELNIGSGANANHFPPAVVASLSPMLDFGSEA